MLIVEGDSVYEIDEQCVASHDLPKECGILEAIARWKNQKEASLTYEAQKERAH